MILKRGDRGDHVAGLQSKLNELGFDCGKPDGQFGPMTESAVRAWEQDAHVTGVVDDADWAIMHPVERRKTGDGVPRGQIELIELYGRPWVDPVAWWKQWGAAANIGLEFAHVLKPRTIGGVRGCFIWVNRDIVDDVESIFKTIADDGNAQSVQTFDGCFCVRAVRGTEDNPRYSTHTWAVAIDLNAKTNGLGIEGDMDPSIIRVFKDHGWVCGADFKRRKDYMHFQRVTGM